MREGGEIRGIRVTFRDVSHIYPGGAGALRALANVSFDAKPGEFVSFLGPSGCGKTTLLNAAAGLLRCTGGEVLVDGAPVTDPSADRAIIFQDHNLFPWKTVLGNVAFGLKARGVPGRERREKARAYVDLVRLTGFEDRRPHELSGGMRQRVAIARALVLEPACLLMDEPFGALDSLLRSHLQRELLSILGNGTRTVLFVTHDVDEAIYLSDRVVIMSPRPGTIHRIVDVDLPRPRDAATRLSLAFQEIKRTVTGVLALDPPSE